MGGATEEQFQQLLARSAQGLPLTDAPPVLEAADINISDLGDHSYECLDGYKWPLYLVANVKENDDIVVAEELFMILDQKPTSKAEYDRIVTIFQGCAKIAYGRKYGIEPSLLKVTSFEVQVMRPKLDQIQHPELNQVHWEDFN